MRLMDSIFADIDIIVSPPIMPAEIRGKTCLPQAAPNNTAATQTGSIMRAVDVMQKTKSATTFRTAAVADSHFLLRGVRNRPSVKRLGQQLIDLLDRNLLRLARLLQMQRHGEDPL